jgi:deoxycytidylate deaminase
MALTFANKWVCKYMKLAKTLADDNDACFSRKIGVVLVSSENTIISMGYNGAPRKCPHNDDHRYLLHIYEDMLTDRDEEYLRDTYGVDSAKDFVNQFTGSKQCPRRILGVESGQRLDLCSCAHAERNCLANANVAGVSTLNSIMYCWCGCPCRDCAIQIIQARVGKVVCLKCEDDAGDYDNAARWLLEQSEVELAEVSEYAILGEG